MTITSALDDQEYAYITHAVSGYNGASYLKQDYIFVDANNSIVWALFEDFVVRCISMLNWTMVHFFAFSNANPLSWGMASHSSGEPFPFLLNDFTLCWILPNGTLTCMSFSHVTAWNLLHGNQLYLLFFQYDSQNVTVIFINLEDGSTCSSNLLNSPSSIFTISRCSVTLNNGSAVGFLSAYNQTTDALLVVDSLSLSISSLPLNMNNTLGYWSFVHMHCTTTAVSSEYLCWQVKDINYLELEPFLLDINSASFLPQLIAG